jgi:nucleoside-diphosphate-sugar epimerase
MKVLLTGASGYIGSVVAEKLVAGGHQVFGLARSSHTAALLRERGIESRSGDLLAPDGLAATVAGMDAVIHTANTKDHTAESADRAAVDAFLTALAGSDRGFVYTSGNLVLGNTGKEVADEDSPIRPIQFVAWRPAVEQTVLGAATRGVAARVLRPAWVYGRQAGYPSILVRTAGDLGHVPFVGDGGNHMTFVHVEDLADLYVLVLEKAAPGSLYSGSVLPAVTVHDLAVAASQAGGAEGKTFSWPRADALQSFGEERVEVMTCDQQISGARAERDLGWQPAAPTVLEELAAGAYKV